MTITAIVTSGIGREIEEKVLPDDFFEVNTPLPRFDIDLGRPVREVGVVIKKLQAGPALELEGRSEPAIEDNDLLKGIQVSAVMNWTRRTNGVSRGKIKDGGGELPLEVQALVRYVGDENFHVTDTMNVNEAGLATGSLQCLKISVTVVTRQLKGGGASPIP